MQANQIWTRLSAVGHIGPR